MTLSSCAEQNQIPAEVLSQINKDRAVGSGTRQENYTGEYLCNQGATGLTLQIIGGDTYNSTYGIFHFFPILTNPNVSAGSFVVKGIFDAEHGLINMEPVSWITRPFGFTAVGLRGVSTDRGNSFEGQVTGAFMSCSTFVVKKVKS